MKNDSLLAWLYIRLFHRSVLGSPWIGIMPYKFGVSEEEMTERKNNPTYGPALKWDELANEHDKRTGGCTRIQQPDTIFKWAKSMPDVFYIHPKKGTVHLILEEKMREFTVNKGVMGFVVTIGCQTAGFSTKEDLAKAVSEYILDPEGVEKKLGYGKFEGTISAGGIDRHNVDGGTFFFNATSTSGGVPVKDTWTNTADNQMRANMENTGDTVK